MANPVFNNSPVFQDPVQRRGQKSPTSTVSYGTPGPQVADAATLDQMYDAPAATTRDTGRLTYDDVIMKTAGLLAVLVVTGAATWVLAPGLWIFGAIVGLVLGLVNAFKKEPSPPLILLYAAAQGVFLGGLSRFYEAQFQGIVGQAVLATLSVFAVSLVLFKSGKVRVTPKFQRTLLIAMVGYLVFSLINVVFMLFGNTGDGYGPLRAGWIGVAVGLIAVVLAAAMLIVDFDSIKRGVEAGVPAKLAWTAAFGLVVTLVWLYLELLRLFAILRGD
ncbi:Bax inhibitor-1/YccA family protein [Cellulomonas humilata]|uniref:YccA/Bax inhibitor family protein n=1 Tax=Cellulomonas humilata TaxID=144055 RepID=A0ABU0E9R2_9CELL|nr:Bax inhibitor-1/YccA family protein [Cellulomonas humilata]MDQ0371942.1 putative YccA/Bax inhibitor family protein [Cellulomonas humilata]